VSLDVQGEVFVDLLEHLDLERPHVVAHDYGGAVSLRAHLLHGAAYSSLALVSVVALRPWGSEYFRHVNENAEVLAAVPGTVHEGALRGYVGAAAHRPLSADDLERLVEPWLGPEGQPAFYRQIAEANERYTDEIEPLYPTIDLPTLVVWGREESVIPVDRAYRLAEAIPNAELAIVEGANHLIQLDQPVALSAVLTEWLLRRASAGSDSGDQLLQKSGSSGGEAAGV